ncbi:MAG: glycosyltransferase [Candidatus Hydrogenedentota bacterium]
MKIALLSTHDLRGGAALAAHRLKQGFTERGAAARMIVLDRTGSDPGVEAFEGSRSATARAGRFAMKTLIAGQLGRFPRRRPFYPERGLMGRDLAERVSEFDIVHIHAVTQFIDLGEFLPAAVRRTRIAWTLHDMNVITGGCHYDEDCGRWRSGCGACPVLDSHEAADLSSRTWARKSRLFNRLSKEDICFITPSRWLSSLLQDHPFLGRFRREVISNGIDTTVFQPRPKDVIRAALEIPRDARVILFISEWTGDARKGGAELPALMKTLQEDDPRTLLLTAGKGASPADCRSRSLGYVSPELLPLAYGAADLLLLPSRGDNFPNAVLEAYACGIPVVAYAAGGIPEMVRSGETGRLVPVNDAPALLDAARALLQDEAGRIAMGRKARELAVAQYDYRKQAAAHLDLFGNLLGDPVSRP